MAEELNTTPIENEPAEHTMDFGEVADQTVGIATEAPAEELQETIGAHATQGDPTEFLGFASNVIEPAFEPAPTEPITVAATELDAAPTESLGAATEEIPAPVESTTPIPSAAPTMAGFDVPVTEQAPEVAAPAAPAATADPYAPAAAAAAAAAPFAARVATPAPAQPVEPWRQASQQSYGQPTYANPDVRPGAYQNAVQHQAFAPDPQVNPYEESLTKLTGGMKFGWLCVGLLLGIPGMIIAWLVTADKHEQVKHDAIMWSVIGFAINFVFSLIAVVAFTGIMAAAIQSVASGYGGYYF